MRSHAYITYDNTHTLQAEGRTPNTSLPSPGGTGASVTAGEGGRGGGDVPLSRDSLLQYIYQNRREGAYVCV